ncbi:MAG: AGE family epimerase/isomerase [Treponema sp.]|nr:AGE family epimerase/isomerase [Treponema sp.]
MLNKQEAEQMVMENILPFWKGMIDSEYGGFYGEADFNGRINKTADKGGILNSRILWTFSAAYNLFKDDSCKAYAAHARDYLLKAFYDYDYGGIYWLVDYKGSPIQTRKQFYNIAFAVYALSEYHLAFRDQSSLELAMSLFNTLEKHGLDGLEGGYIEARTRDWNNIDDFRLSDKDLNCPKSMNTNLHVLEAYTTLLRANAESGNAQIKNALKDLLRITLDKIVSRAFHFKLFFDMEWRSLSNEVSYGHDIEGSWLMYEAALAVGDESLINETRNTAITIADVIFKDVLEYKDGKPENSVTSRGLISGCDENGNIRTKKEWWPQAEAVAGFYNAYELSGRQKYLDAANSIWEYIKNYFADNTGGEWHNELFADDTPDTKMPKACFWKCPYHSARACFEIIKRMK